MSRSVRCALVILSLFRTQSSQYAIPAFVVRKSVARFLCRILLPNGVGICGSYHDETTITLGPARPPSRAPRRTEGPRPEPTRSPAWNGWRAWTRIAELLEFGSFH